MRYILDGKEVTIEEIEKLGLTIVDENFTLLNKNLFYGKVKKVKRIEGNLTDEELIKLTSL